MSDYDTIRDCERAVIATARQTVSNTPDPPAALYAAVAALDEAEHARDESDRAEDERRARLIAERAPLAPGNVYAHVASPDKWDCVITGIEWPGRYDYGGGGPGVSVTYRERRTGAAGWWVVCDDDAGFFRPDTWHAYLCNYTGPVTPKLRRLVAQAKQRTRTVGAAA